MILLDSNSSLGTDRQGETACGASVRITSDTPFIYYQGEIIYFCAENCKQLYTQSSLNSCMAIRIISAR